jgi:hypothetical protein
MCNIDAVRCCPWVDIVLYLTFCEADGHSEILEFSSDSESTNIIYIYEDSDSRMVHLDKFRPYVTFQKFDMDEY